MAHPTELDDDGGLDPRFRGDDTKNASHGVFLLFSYVWEQRHKPCALDCLRQLSLMLGADAGMLRVDHLCLARNKTPEKVHFLVIDIIEILGTEKTLCHN